MFRISGTLSGATEAAGTVTSASTFTPPADHLYYDITSGRAPQTGAGAVSATIPPEYYTVALKKLTLLGDSSAGTADYEVLSESILQTAEAVDFMNATTFFESDTFPTAGTYSGIQMEVFYIEMQVPVVIPMISYNEATYTMRGYFTEVDNIQPRDITVFHDDNQDGISEEFWISEDLDANEPYGLVAVTGNRPLEVFDLWENQVFWAQDPVIISTAANLQGTDFTFSFEEGTTTFVTPENPIDDYEITLNFNVTNRFNWWEYLYDEADELTSDPTVDASHADGMSVIGFDAGYSILFPNVQLSVDEGSSEV